MTPENVDIIALNLYEKSKCWKCCNVWGMQYWNGKELIGEICMICNNVVNNRIRIPSSTAYLVCYDCFSYWVEGYEPKELVFKIINHYRITNK